MKFPLRFGLLLLFVLAPSLHAELTFRFMQTAEVSPQAFENTKTGPFGETFIATPAWRFFPRPNIPKSLRKTDREGHARVALLVGKNGRVKEVKVIDASPEGEVEKAAMAFFRRVVYKAEPIGQFETDAVLLFRRIPSEP